MENFAIIVGDIYLFTIIANLSILDVCTGVLATPLIFLCSVYRLVLVCNLHYELICIINDVYNLTLSEFKFFLDEVFSFLHFRDPIQNVASLHSFINSKHSLHYTFTIQDITQYTILSTMLLQKLGDENWNCFQ